MRPPSSFAPKKGTRACWTLQRVEITLGRARRAIKHRADRAVSPRRKKLEREREREREREQTRLSQARGKTDGGAGRWREETEMASGRGARGAGRGRSSGRLEWK
jgi:hypothetical protein